MAKKNLVDELNEIEFFKKIFENKTINKFVTHERLHVFLNHRHVIKFFNYEVISYLFFGLAATVVSFGSFIAISGLFKLLVNNYGANFGITEITDAVRASITLFANILSIAITVLFQYFTNSKWVFRSTAETLKEKWSEFFRFLSARTITIVFEMITVPTLVYFGFPDVGSKIFITIFVVILNYIFSKILVFKDKKE